MSASPSGSDDSASSSDSIATAGLAANETENSAAKWTLATLCLAVVAMSLLTIVMRWPSAGESFWIDELHSAWAVHGSFDEVAWRASVGNQTTGYFHLLWLWKSLVGESEIALRSISILASVITVGLLVVGVTWQTGRLAGGIVAGGIVTLDPNAVFFGVELRPYALVMTCAVLAVWSMMVWLRDQPKDQPPGEPLPGTASAKLRRSHAGARWRLSMLFWICVAALIHPTSLGVLGWLLPTSMVAAWWRGRLRLWRADVVAAVVLAATMVSLAMSSLPDSWAVRDRWRAFGQATDVQQLWLAWDWMPVVAAPLVLFALTLILSRVPTERGEGERENLAISNRWISLLPAVVGVLGTLTFFVASYYQWVPLWHRRYFVSALPLLAWSAGATVAILSAQLSILISSQNRLRRFTWLGPATASIIAMGFLAGLLRYQGTLDSFYEGRIPLQLRGEPWREVVQQLKSNRVGRAPVWLSSGLIEADFFRRPVSDAMDLGSDEWSYLGFPLAGSYAAEPVTVVACGEHPSWIRQHLAMLPPDPVTVWLVVRGRQEASRSFIATLARVRRVNATRVFMSPGLSLTRLDFRTKKGAKP